MEHIVKVTGSSEEPRCHVIPTILRKGRVYYARVGGKYFKINAESNGPVPEAECEGASETEFPSTWRRKTGSTMVGRRKVAFECYCDSKGNYAGFCLVDSDEGDAITGEVYESLIPSVEAFAKRLRYDWIFTSLSRSNGKRTLDRHADRVYALVSPERNPVTVGVTIKCYYEDGAEDEATIFPGEDYVSVKHSAKVLAVHVANPSKLEVKLTALRFYPR